MNIAVVAVGLRMNFRVAGHFNMKVIASLFAYKLYQLVGVKIL